MRAPSDRVLDERQERRLRNEAKELIEGAAPGLLGSVMDEVSVREVAAVKGMLSELAGEALVEGYRRGFVAGVAWARQDVDV